MRRILRRLFPHRKPNPWVCRGPVLGHSWLWVDGIGPGPGLNDYGRPRSHVRCRRCGVAIALGIALEMRDGMRRFRRFQAERGTPL